MKRMMIIGRPGCGKTTLVQAVNNCRKAYAKTQALEFHANMIDTPGEYIENRLFYKALIVTSAECDIIALVQDCTDKDCVFPPRFADIFPKPVIGIISKVDSKSDDVTDTIRCLETAGVKAVYATSSYTGEGIEALKKILE
jgi:ethanolamine utilization protein EutP